MKQSQRWFQCKLYCTESRGECLCGTMRWNIRPRTTGFDASPFPGLLSLDEQRTITIRRALGRKLQCPFFFVYICRSLSVADCLSLCVCFCPSLCARHCTGYARIVVGGRSVVQWVRVVDADSLSLLLLLYSFRSFDL